MLRSGRRAFTAVSCARLYVKRPTRMPQKDDFKSFATELHHVAKTSRAIDYNESPISVRGLETPDNNVLLQYAEGYMQTPEGPEFFKDFLKTAGYLKRNVLYDIVRKNFLDLALHKYGHQVVISCLQCAPENIKIRMLKGLRNIKLLSVDKYGIKVLHELIDNGTEEQKKRIHEYVIANSVIFSRHYPNHELVFKCLEQFNELEAHLFVSQIIHTNAYTLNLKKTGYKGKIMRVADTNYPSLMYLAYSNSGKMVLVECLDKYATQEQREIMFDFAFENLIRLLCNKYGTSFVTSCMHFMDETRVRDLANELLDAKGEQNNATLDILREKNFVYRNLSSFAILFRLDYAPNAVIKAIKLGITEVSTELIRLAEEDPENYTTNPYVKALVNDLNKKNTN